MMMFAPSLESPLSEPQDSQQTPEAAQSALPSPSGLSPSRMDRFTKCRRSYRLRYIDGLPDPPTLPAVLGTLAHQVLEDMFGWPPAERTEQATIDHIPAAWRTVVEARPEYVTAWDSLDTTEAALFAAAEEIVATYFTLEDPTTLHDSRQETWFHLTVAGVPFRGCADRTDTAPGSGLERITDYKSGRAPSNELGAAERMHQLKLYALVRYWQTGRIPAQVRLMFLGGDGGFLTYSPSAAGMAIARRRLEWVWGEVNAAHETGDFPPNPQPLCAWCPFTSVCPEGEAAAVEYRARKEQEARTNEAAQA